MKNIIGLMAASKNGAVGLNNALPWHYPDDLEHFRNTAHNQIMIMGNNTYKSLPKNLLADRISIIFSKSHSLTKTDDVGIVKKIYGKAIYINSLIDFYALKLPYEMQDKKIYMIGGAEIAALFLENNLIDEFILTKIYKDYAGNRFIDLKIFEKWQEIILQTTENYTIYKFTK